MANSPVTCATYALLHQAQMAEARLSEAGIASWLNNAGGAGLLGGSGVGLGEISVWVSSDDLEDAQRILADGSADHTFELLDTPVELREDPTADEPLEETSDQPQPNPAGDVLPTQTNPSSGRLRKAWLSHWRGETPVVQAVVRNGLLPYLLLHAVDVAIRNWGLELSQPILRGLLVAQFAVAQTIAVWWIVGIWRLIPRRVVARLARRRTPVVALRGFVIVTWLPFYLLGWLAAPGAESVITGSLYGLALPGQVTWESTEKTHLYITGFLSETTVELVSNELKRGHATTLVLNSPGGWSKAGIALGDLVKNRKLNTIAYGECQSACVVAWLSGAHVAVHEGTVIGLHRETVVSAQSCAAYSPYVTRLRALGMPESMIRRLCVTAPDQVWTPSLAEFLRLKLADAILPPVQSAPPPP
ncbi:MAG: DUF2007 domain-containing protein [Myxococcales bacterium]|nr:DUF2007 domain-containing protein [Myxococcales bacterium]